MRWLNEPPSWADDGGALRLTTAPDTDFWRTTHYGFVRDTGHFRHTQGDFTAEVRVEGRYRDRYDQAGLMVRLDAETWLKCGIEFVDGRQCASVVITRGLSDWSVVPLERAPASVCFRLGDGGERPEAEQAVGLVLAVLRVGVMAASPDGAGFGALLRDFRLTGA